MNIIDNEIVNNNKIITNILNKTINQVVTNNIKTRTTTVNLSSVDGNKIAIAGDVRATGGGTITFLQQHSSKLTAKVLSDISSNDSERTAFTSEISSDIVNKLKNNNDITQALKANNVLENIKNTEGEVNNVMKTIGNIVGNITGAKSEDITKQTLLNKLYTSVNNTNISETNLTNILKNIVTNNIENKINNNCGILTNSYNDIAINGGVFADGTGSTIFFSQDTLIDDFIKCIFTEDDTISLYDDTTMKAITENLTDVTNATKTISKADLDNAQKLLEAQTSYGNIIADAITKNIQMIIIALIVIGVGALIVFGIILLRKKGGTKMDSLIDTGLDKVMDIGVKKVDNTLSDMLDPLKDNPQNVATTLKYLLNL